MNSMPLKAKTYLRFLVCCFLLGGRTFEQYRPDKKKDFKYEHVGRPGFTENTC